jgi:hypothetical protein
MGSGGLVRVLPYVKPRRDGRLRIREAYSVFLEALKRIYGRSVIPQLWVSAISIESRLVSSFVVHSILRLCRVCVDSLGMTRW